MIDLSIEQAHRPANHSRCSLKLVLGNARCTEATDLLGAAGTKKPSSAKRKNPPEIVASGIFDELFGMLKTRLRMTAAECSGPATGSTEHLRAHQVEARVLECAAALDYVHAALTPNIVRLYQIERELHEVRADLARTQAELALSRVSEKQARHLAMHDVLTALPNRGFFQQKLDQALSPLSHPQHALAVLYIDLNGFKSLNDVHGHHTGDKVLRIVADRLAHAVRAEDTVSRLGGDEFGCLLTGRPDRRWVSDVAAKVFDVVSAPVNVGTSMISMRPSIGIAVSPDDGATSEVLLRSADAAMYHAKRHRACYAFFSEVM